MIDNNKEYILCAAIKRKATRSHKNGCPYWDGINDIMDIEIGYRHHDIYQRFGKELSSNPYHQGFYTSKGRFVGRYEGMKIAYEAGQLSDNVSVFHDEKVLNEVKLNCVDIQPSTNKNDVDPEYYEKYFPLFSENLY